MQTHSLWGPPSPPFSCFISSLLLQIYGLPFWESHPWTAVNIFLILCLFTEAERLRSQFHTSDPSDFGGHHALIYNGHAYVP